MFNYVNKKLLSIFFVIILFFGCKTSDVLESDSSNFTASKIFSVNRNNYNLIKQFKAEGRLSIQTNRGTQNASINVEIHQPDSILILIEGPFGIKVGNALITRNNFIFYNSLENKVIHALTNKLNLSRILQVEIEYDDLVSVLLGVAFCDERFEDKTIISFLEGNIILKDNMDSMSKQYIVNQDNMLINKIQHYQKNKMLYEQHYSGFEKIGDGVTLPSNIQFTHFNENKRLIINYKDISVNKDCNPLNITYPETAKVVQW